MFNLLSLPSAAKARGQADTNVHRHTDIKPA